MILLMIHLLITLLTATFRPGLKKVGFVSYPRSGNTWFRRILERATGTAIGSLVGFTSAKNSCCSLPGVLTGSVYWDKLLVQSGLLGEGKNEGVLMVKDHWPIQFYYLHPKVVDWADCIIHIVRNPFKSIESYYHYTYSGYTHTQSQAIDRTSSNFRCLALS